MRIGHTADLHAAYRQYGRKEREQDFYDIIDSVVDEMIKHRVDVALFAGDIFDCLKPCSEAVQRIQNAVAKLTSAGIFVCGIAGNHDACRNEWLDICHIHSLDGQVHTVKGIKITGKNWCRPSVFMEELEADVEAGIKADVYAIHQPIEGLTGFGSPETPVDRIAAALKKMGVSYAALGDIHQYTETVCDGITFCYPGSPERCAANDGDVKSFTLVDYTKPGVKPTTQTVILHPREFVRIAIKSEQDLDGLMAMLNKQPTPVVVLTYEPEFRELARRAEGLLRSANIIYRMYPVTTTTTKEAVTLSVNEFERHSMMELLNKSIEAFFTSDSEEAKLIKEIMASPDPAGVLRSFTKERLDVV